MRHDHYKELCVLAVSGQMKAPESTELQEHLATCEQCRTELADFGRIATGLDGLSGEHRSIEMPAGTTERFLARARSEGIPLGRKLEKPALLRVASRTRAIGLAIAATLTLGVTSYIISRSHSGTRVGAPVPTLNSGPVQSNAQPATNELQEKLLQENADLKANIQSLQAQLSALSAQVLTDKEQFKTEQLEKRLQNVRVADAENSAATLRQGLGDREQEIAQLKKNIESLKSEKDADSVASQVQEGELNSIREQMAKLELKLREAQQLSEAANEAKDLIVARNLHIVDVNDTDENGRRQRPFGRIFYAEGQALKFYAYDLADTRRLNAKINFYVWGSKEGATKSAKSLGMFQSDDADDRRWVLEFKDARVLAQIDCVFVTAESDKKPVTQPTGRQILFASLGRNPNHP